MHEYRRAGTESLTTDDRTQGNRKRIKKKEKNENAKIIC